MHCSRNALGMMVCLGLLCSSSLGAKKSDSGDPDATPTKKESPAKKGDKNSDKKGAKPDKKPDKKTEKLDDTQKKAPVDPNAPPKMSIPIVKGHDSLGLKIPYYNGEGILQMIFNITVATRLDEDHLKMNSATVETFDEAGAHEMSIALPVSYLDLNTRVITTQQHVTIKRADFEITGNTMEFNTETKQGRLGGGVRMLIYNLESEEAAKPESADKTEDAKSE